MFGNKEHIGLRLSEDDKRREGEGTTGLCAQKPNSCRFITTTTYDYK